MSVVSIFNGLTVCSRWLSESKLNKGNPLNRLTLIFLLEIVWPFYSHFRTRTIYFHALASTKEFSVPNFVLQNETRALSSESYNDYSIVGDRGANGQSTAEFLDENSNVLVYTQINKDGIGCWNATKPYTPDTQGIIDSDSDALVFPNDLKIDPKGNVWVLSDRLPTFIYKKLDTTQFNYRVLTGKVSELILGTPCE